MEAEYYFAQFIMFHLISYLNYRNCNFFHKTIKEMSIPQPNHSYSRLQERGPLQANVLNTHHQSHVVKTEVRTGDVIKGESQISYVPFEKKVIEYEDRVFVEKRPIKRKVIEYEERRYIENVPREVTKIDYYAVENIKQYIKQVVPEKKIQMVAKERKVKKVQYIPVQKQIVHYPNSINMQTAIHEGTQILSHSGFQLNHNTQYKQLNPGIIQGVVQQQYYQQPPVYGVHANSRVMSSHNEGNAYIASQNLQGQQGRETDRASSREEQIYDHE